jgi:hypothetical protein
MASLMNQRLEWFKAGILYMRYLRQRVRAMVLIDTFLRAHAPL